MNIVTNNQAGIAVARSSRNRAGDFGYPTTSWSATAGFGCASLKNMGHADHKSTRPRPLEPSQ